MPLITGLEDTEKTRAGQQFWECSFVRYGFGSVLCSRRDLRELRNAWKVMPISDQTFSGRSQAIAET
ncbi:MAG: hypothetical protein ACOYMS_04155, partial [Terrimicrobiaceae bacterium]